MLAKLVEVTWSKTYRVHHVLIQHFYVVQWLVTMAVCVLVQRAVTVCELCSNLALL
jgi:hypothetical protein